MVLLICVDRHEVDILIKEIHEGSFGTHANGHAMEKKILRIGHYWLTMESDCFNYVWECHKWQIYANKVHIPLTRMNVLTTPWPFYMWGINMIGIIETKASNGYHFIMIVIEYFTKWVESVSYTNVTRKVVVRFITKEIIFVIGFPARSSLITPAIWTTKMMKELCESFKSEHHNSSRYRPKMNGVVEPANNNIKRLFRKWWRPIKTGT